MNERFKRPTLVNHLKRFFGGDKKQVIDAIDQQIENDDDLDTGKLFFRMTSGKGKGKQHVSGKKEGDIKTN